MPDTIGQPLEFQNAPPGEPCRECRMREAVGLYLPDKYSATPELIARCAECADLRQRTVAWLALRRSTKAPYRWL